MSEKTKPQINLSNDVQVIRNILFGEHLERIQKQLESLEKELAAARKENKALWKELKAENEQHFEELGTRLEQSNNAQGQANEALRQDFDAQIREISKRLLSHEEQQGGLLSSLAEALTQVR
jgi:septal ring factor EnvC (AmiA/AmiB activator)